MQRQTLIDVIKQTDVWDVIVIGGGATGLGAAVDSASRGFKTLLLEAHDFSKGTSSRSTKLVHGGVRYLASGQIGLVVQGLRERGLLRKNAPHLVRTQAFIVPLYSWFDGGWYGTGLTLYNVMAGKLGLGRTKIISAKQARKYIPTLEPHDLKGGVVYYDGQFDDSRLCITLMLTLLDHQGTALNYAPVIGLIKENGKVRGVQIRDEETQQTYDIKARVVINATGIFTDEVRRLDDPNIQPMIAFSQGIHIVLDRAFLPGEHAIMVPKTADGRVLFIIPWHNHVIVGTTDTPRDHAELEPRPLAEELDFVLTHAAKYLSKDPTKADVLSTYAGLRPLVKTGNAAQTAALSRDHVIRVSKAGLVTITGGKWTSYRHMAEDVVDRAIQTAGLESRPCLTANMNLHGWSSAPTSEPLRVYGSDAPDVQALCKEQAGWDELLHSALPYRVGEVIWAVRYELARTVEDVLARRTRALFLNAEASRSIAPRVAELIASELGYDQAWQDQQIAEFEQLCKDYMV